MCQFLPSIWKIFPKKSKMILKKHKISNEDLTLILTSDMEIKFETAWVSSINCPCE